MTRVARQAHSESPRGNPARDREAARSWVAFIAEHTIDHAQGRCPVTKLYESWLGWAADRGLATAPLGVVIAWMREAGYRISGVVDAEAVDEGAVWFGIIGREYDPEGWPDGWQWPWLDSPNPPSWYVARSRMRRGATSRRLRGATESSR